MGDADESDALELSVQRGDDFDALYAELRGVPGIEVQALPAPVQPGEQGSIVDLLTVALSGGAITAFLEIIKALLESRGPGFVLKLKRGGDRLEITADSVDEALPALRELLRGQ